jgi:hypothetical protein
MVLAIGHLACAVLQESAARAAETNSNMDSEAIATTAAALFMWISLEPTPILDCTNASQLLQIVIVQHGREAPVSSGESVRTMGGAESDTHQ